MQPKRGNGELVPIGDALSGLDDVLVSALRNDSPQALPPLHPGRPGGPSG